jgi:hypothetical protein
MRQHALIETSCGRFIMPVMLEQEKESATPVMFEQEVELEKSRSSMVPLLLIGALIVIIAGAAGYYIWENQRVMNRYEASSLAIAALNAQGPALIRFHTGVITPSVDLKPRDRNYRLLEKAGLLKLGKDREGRLR